MVKLSAINVLSQEKQKLIPFAIHYLLALVIIITMVIGKAFTKYAVLPNIYLHDTFILLLCLIGINTGRIIVRNSEVLFVIALSFIYFTLSILFLRDHPEFYFKIAVRQYGLFIYLAFAYILFNTFYRSRDDLDKLLKFIIWIGKASYFLTWAKILYIHFIIKTDAPFEFRFYSYIAVLGVITFSAYTLLYRRGMVRYLLYFSCLLLAILTKQAAFFLSIMVVGIAYFFFRIKVAHRITFLAIGFIGIGFLFLAPDFTDANVKWRLLYWRHILSNAADHYLIFGNGFGIPYMTADYSYYIENRIQSSILTPEYDPLARHINPPHNSFLTIVFHIGLLPFLILLWPLRRILNLFFLQSFHNNNKVPYFLILTLIGSIVWCSFNVILELPHSAVYFWLIYFTTALFLKEEVTPFKFMIKTRNKNQNETI
jgi:hypothetical protein